MTNINKLSGLDTFGFKTAQTHLLENWCNTLDTTYDSISNFYSFTTNIFNQMTRQQNDVIKIYMSRKAKELNTEIEHDGDKAAKIDSDTGLAVITGGIGGIGKEICKRLAADGHRIVSTYIPHEESAAVEWKKSQQNKNVDAEIYQCDVTDYTKCKNMARDIEKKYGKVDILVNCAGITQDARLVNMDPAQWQAVLDTNLDSVFNITRSFINGMIKNKYGRIINISSVNGQKGQFGQTNYAAAKAGMIGLTRSLALEFAQDGITVNCVCPGYVATSLVEAIRDDIKQAIIDQIPIGRLADPAEVAHAVAFLASRNSGYITGTEIALNGGLWMG